MKILSVILITMLLSVSGAFAQSVEFKGRGSLEYEGGFTGKPTTEEMQKTRQKAIEAAWNNYLSKLDASAKKNYEKNKASINYKDFILETYTIDETTDKKMKVYNVLVRVKIDTVGFSNKLSSFASTNKKDSDERSYVLALFVGREVASVTKFDDKKTKVASYEESVNANANMAVGETSESMSASAGKQAKVQTGGSTVIKKDAKAYNIKSITKFSGAFENVLTESGYEPVSYEDILDCGAPNLDDIKAQFATNDELKPELWKLVRDAAKECEISYIVLGYVDVTMPRPDASSGRQEVTASATGKVYDLKGRLSRSIASVEPKVFSAKAHDSDVAEINATTDAAKAAAEAIVNQLHAKDAY